MLSWQELQWGRAGGNNQGSKWKDSRIIVWARSFRNNKFWFLGMGLPVLIRIRNMFYNHRLDKKRGGPRWCTFPGWPHSHRFWICLVQSGTVIVNYFGNGAELQSLCSAKPKQWIWVSHSPLRGWQTPPKDKTALRRLNTQPVFVRVCVGEGNGACVFWQRQRVFKWNEKWDWSQASEAISTTRRSRHCRLPEAFGAGKIRRNKIDMLLTKRKHQPHN